MPEHKVIVTWEAIYDMADIMDYIEADFGEERADRFQVEMKRELEKSFPPSIIFYIVKEPEQEVHVLRVVREEQNWERILCDERDYTYPNETN